MQVNCTPVCRIAVRCWRRGDRQVLRTRHSRRRTLHAVRPSEEGKKVESEVVEEEDLPEYVPDPILNTNIYNEERDLTKMDPEKRRTRVIVELVNAGDAFETKLKEYSDYLDVKLLEAFYKRIEMAEKHEDKSAGEGLRLIWRRVRAEVERKNASPSMRLLDKLLGLLHPTAGGTSKERYRSALGLLHEAFTNSQSETVDIFSLAESLAGGDPAPSGLLQEFVRKSAFIAEVEELLHDAQRDEAELMERREDIVRLQMEAEIDTEPYKELSTKLRSIDDFMVQRESSLKDVALLLDMAKAI